MMTKTLLIASLMMAATAAAAADKDMYERLSETLIYAHDFPNEDVHALLADGMASEDPEIAELILDGLGVKAFMESVGEDWKTLRMGGPRPMPDRELNQVPGLKDWLISRYLGGYDEWNKDYSVLFDPSIVPDEGRQGFVEIFSKKPGWVYVPYVLARNWREDSDVHDLLLGDSRVYQDMTLVSLLNQGGFVSDEANRERWDVLSTADGDRDMLLAATKGLAMSGNTEAIPHLLDLVEQHGVTRHAVAEYLSGYPAAELTPHAERIKVLVEEVGSGVFGAPTSAGFYKLRSLVDSLEDQ